MLVVLGLPTSKLSHWLKQSCICVYSKVNIIHIYMSVFVLLYKCMHTYKYEFIMFVTPIKQEKFILACLLCLSITSSDSEKHDFIYIYILIYITYLISKCM